MLTDYSRLTAAMLDRMENAVLAQAPHLSPVVQVVRDCGVGFLVIPQRATGLDRGIDLLARPFVVLIGDDMDSALGPDQYDRAALKRLIDQIDGVAIVCSEPPPEAYSSIALLAAAGHNGLIIETRPEQEIAWTKLVQGVRADMPILLCSVKASRQ